MQAWRRRWFCTRRQDSGWPPYGIGRRRWVCFAQSSRKKSRNRDARLPIGCARKRSMSSSDSKSCSVRASRCATRSSAMSLARCFSGGRPGAGRRHLRESSSAVLAGIKEIKDVTAKAEAGRRYHRRTIVFVDEMHRFNRAQQDAFLPHVEAGNILLIGATTENPSFEVISPLLSRMKVYVLHALSSEQIVTLLKRALADRERGLGEQ